MQETTAKRRVVTTEELIALLAAGKKVYLPEMVAPAPEILEHYDSRDRERLGVPASENPVVSVEYVGEEEVQCIAVDDERHLYVTDDMIPTHNTSNIVFLKSTDDSMIDTLQKMSGTTHRTYRDSKTITKDVEKIALQTEGKVSYTMTTKEEPVISYNDLAYLSPRQSIVFRAGDPPVWNRNEMILPMSFRLFKNTITHAGHKYTLQTIPTLSSAREFDVRLNQPNFVEMLSKRMTQATHSPTAADIYRRAYGYDDFEVSRLDPDVYASEVMDIVDAMMAREAYVKSGETVMPVDEDDIPENARDPFEYEDGLGYGEEDDHDAEATGGAGSTGAVLSDDQVFSATAETMEAGFARKAAEMRGEATDNVELDTEVSTQQARQADLEELRYAQRKVSRAMLVDESGRVRPGSLEKELVAAYNECVHFFASDPGFRVGADRDLRSAEGEVFIMARNETEALRQARAAGAQQDSRVYIEDERGLDPAELHEINTFEVTDAFRRYLVSLPHWRDIAEGRFDSEVARQMEESARSLDGDDSGDTGSTGNTEGTR